jgi:hypothetical protein
MAVGHVCGERGRDVPDRILRNPAALLAPRRRVPVVISLLDTPERTRRWFEIVDEATSEAGLVTCEQVPAARAASVGARASGLMRAVSSR